LMEYIKRMVRLELYAILYKIASPFFTKIFLFSKFGKVLQSSCFFTLPLVSYG